MRRFPRRRVLRSGCATAAGAVVLAACGPAARPTAASGTVTVKVALDIYALQQYGTVTERAALFAKVLAEFEAANRGVRVQQVPFINTAAIQTAIVAGSAPDVFPDASKYISYIDGQLLLKLDQYIRRDNVRMSAFSPKMVEWLALPFGTFALSRESDANAFAVDLSALDEAGLPYPPSDWTHTEFAQLCGALTRTTNGKKRIGAMFIYGGFGVLSEFRGGFGAHITDTSRTRQTLSTPQGIAAGDWWFNELLLPGIAATGVGAPGATVIQNLDMNFLLHLFTAWGTQRKWVFYPPPVYPQGRSTGMAGNFWGISATTRVAEQAWALLRWLAVEPVWQRFMMKTFLWPPGLNALLSEWVAVVTQVAPALADKQLHWYTDAAAQGWAHVRDAGVLYQGSNALQIDSTWYNEIAGGKVSVSEGFARADDQVDALEQAAPALETARATNKARFPSRGPAVAQVAQGL